MNCLVGLFIYSLFSGFFALISSDFSWLIATLGATPLVILIAYQIYTGDRELFAPLNFVAVNLFFGVTLQMFYLLVLDQGENRYGLYGTMTTLDTLLTGVFAIILGTIFLILGYSIPRKKRVITGVAEISWQKRKLLFVALLCLMVSMLATISFVEIFNISFDQISAKRRVFESTGASKSYGYLRWGASLAYSAALAVYAYLMHQKGRGYRVSHGMYLLFFALALLGLILPFVSSQRSSIIYFIISLGIINNFLYRPWKLRKVGVIAITTLIVLLFMGMLRFAGKQSDTFNYYMENAGFNSMVSTIAGSANVLGVAKTGIIIERVPSIMDFEFGRTYLLWLVAPIPRNLWADKPIVRIGGVLGPIYETPPTTGAPPGYIGESYFNFGWVGVPLISILFGMMLRVFYEIYGRRARGNLNKTFIYASMFTLVSFSSLSSDFTGLMSRGLQVFIVALFLCYIVSSKQKKQSR